jgi:hypothetical protein
MHGCGMLDLLATQRYKREGGARRMPDATARNVPPPGPAKVPSVVNFRQEGTMYDVPIDVLWEFMSWEGHSAAHEKTLRNMTVLEETPNGALVTFEVMRGGAWRKVTDRVVDFPPLGRVVEEIEGPYKGTQMVFLYTPVGGKTRLDIVARFVSDVLDPEALERHMVDSIENAGIEDDPYLQRFAQARTRS